MLFLGGLTRLTRFNDFIVFCPYLLDRMQRNLIMINYFAIFKWFNWFDVIRQR